MRVNSFIQDHIALSSFKLDSWLDIGTGNGLVTAEWRDFGSIKDKVAIDSGTCKLCLGGRKLFEALDNSWKTFEESYSEKHELWNQTFDLITLMDTIQYYYKPESEKLLDHLLTQANKLLIVWTVDGYYPEQEALSCWHTEEFIKRRMDVIIAENFHQGPPYQTNGLLAWNVKHDLSR